MAVLSFKKAIVYVNILLLPKTLIIVPSLLVVSISGIKLYKKIIKEGKRRTVKMEIAKHTIISAIMLFVMFVPSFIEAYVTPGLLKVFKNFL